MKGIILMNSITTHFLDDYNDQGINLTSIIEPLFLCRWNRITSIDGNSFSYEIVEIHSKDTLIYKYQETNLFDFNEDEEDQSKLIRWIDLISEYHNFNTRPLINDNFEIERIK